MEGIYGNFIEHEIKSQIRLFGARGGDISSFNVNPAVSSFQLVEPACNEGIPDIVGYISPLVFYCNSCHKVFKISSSKNINKSTWVCPSCGKKSVKQLQMVYACECGYAEPVKIPYVPGVHDFLYYSNEEKFKMFHMSGKNRVKDELIQFCPTCNSRLLPDNANSGRNYKPFTLHIINLIDERAGKFFEKGIDAQKTIVAKWFGKLPQDKFDELLEDVDVAFNVNLRDDAKRREVEKQVDDLIRAGLGTIEDRERMINTLLESTCNKYGIDSCVRAYDNLNLQYIGNDEAEVTEWLSSYSFKLMQYETLKHPKRMITLEESIQRQLEIEFIDDPKEITDLNEKLGIENMQVSLDIEIVNCTYGYTRRAADPYKSQEQNRNHPLKLNAYSKTKDGEKNLVYGSKLETEGILFEIDMVRIIKWLAINGIITEEQEPDLDDTECVKKWYAENVHGDVISMFGEIDDSEQITKNVFALLHSMSHAFLKTAGELSGLSDTSLSEIIIVETASIFIYSQSS